MKETTLKKSVKIIQAKKLSSFVKKTNNFTVLCAKDIILNILKIKFLLISIILLNIQIQPIKKLQR